MKLLERSSHIKLRQSLGKAERCWAIDFLICSEKPQIYAFEGDYLVFYLLSKNVNILNVCSGLGLSGNSTSVNAAFNVSRWLISGALMGGYGFEWER